MIYFETSAITLLLEEIARMLPRALIMQRQDQSSCIQMTAAAAAVKKKKFICGHADEVRLLLQ